MIRLGRDKLREADAFGYTVTGCILFEAFDLVRRSVRPVIGEVNTLSERGSMLASLHAALRCV